VVAAAIGRVRGATAGRECGVAAGATALAWTTLLRASVRLACGFTTSGRCTHRGRGRAVRRPVAGPAPWVLRGPFVYAAAKMRTKRRTVKDRVAVRASPPRARRGSRPSRDKTYRPRRSRRTAARRARGGVHRYGIRGGSCPSLLAGGNYVPAPIAYGECRLAAATAGRACAPTLVRTRRRPSVARRRSVSRVRGRCGSASGHAMPLAVRGPLAIAVVQVGVLRPRDPLCVGLSVVLLRNGERRRDAACCARWLRWLFPARAVGGAVPSWDGPKLRLWHLHAVVVFTRWHSRPPSVRRRWQRAV
jgi:hypothetical protein